jgi:hypothetical protein
MTDEKKIPVSIDQVETEVPLKQDVYIKIGGRFLQYGRKGDPLDRVRVENLIRKGLKEFFLEATPPGRTKERGTQASSLETTTLDQMSEQLSRAEAALENRLNWEKYEKHLEAILQEIQKKPHSVAKSLEKTGYSKNLKEHAINTSLLTIYLLIHLGYTDRETFMEASLAAFLHDRGHPQGEDDNKAFMAYPREKLASIKDQETKKAYYSHPSLALEDLERKEMANSHILSLIENHEDIGDPYSYPTQQKLSNQALDQQCLNLANEFDRQCASLNKKHGQHFSKFQKEYNEHFGEDLLKGLSLLFQE